MIDNLIKIKKESESNAVCCSDDNYYPYGTSLNLDDELVEELNVNNLAVGDVVEVRGFAFVESKSENDSISESSKNVRLQFTAIKIERESDDRVEQLYGVNS